jgi:DNA polymerase III epsilon subunit-like protein
MSDDDIRDDIRGIALVLNELINGGSRICTREERQAAWARADEALERLKARYGIPAGRGDTDQAEVAPKR